MADGTAKFQRSARPSPAAHRPDTLDERVARIDATVVDVRVELEELTGIQKRGNVISLKVQGELRALDRKVDAGFRNLSRQNDEILRLLKEKTK